MVVWYIIVHGLGTVSHSPANNCCYIYILFESQLQNSRGPSKKKPVDLDTVMWYNAKNLQLSSL